MSRDEALKRADTSIRLDRVLIYDVAANLGQIVDNVKHMKWFREAVADWIQEEAT